MDHSAHFLEFSTFEAACSKGQSLVLEELWDCPKALLLARAQKATGKHIVLLSSGVAESRLFDDLPFFGIEPKEFPAWETLPHENIPPSPDVVGERYRLLEDIDTTPQFFVTSLQAVLQKILPKRRLEALHLPLHVGQEIPFALLPDYLSEMGYHEKSVAADKGEFAIRGGIIDIFPVSSPDPVRIEFFDDEIASIRKYDPIGQTSVGKIKQISITPGEELELLAKEQELATLFDYLGRDTIVVFDEPFKLEDKYVTLKAMLEKKVASFATLDELMKTIEPLQMIHFVEESLESLSHVKLLDRTANPYSEKAPPQPLSFEAFSTTFEASRIRHPFLPLIESFCPPDHDLDHFSAAEFLEVLNRSDVEAHFVFAHDNEERKWRRQLTKEGTFHRGYLSSGFYIEKGRLALIAIPELTGRYRVRRQKQRSHYHSAHAESVALTPGESVVHLQNGIGKYVGIDKRENHLGVETEFMILEYAEGARLFVPMDQANMVSKYIGTSDKKPELHQIGSKKWARARERTEQAVIGYAEDLLELQAKRAMRAGFCYPNHGEMMVQFSDEFPYEETPDQMAAIEKIHDDMCSQLSMERLVCGDVGYGKTEVAMRAAFKAVADGGKQVAVLVPTTVLAMQHYETFSARMQNFPLRIGILSRFQKPKEIKKTLEELALGQIDIVVGTHRIVSQDVAFANLGLVIIDEEQRFGVKAKEHLKKLRSEVDCLTLSATPIPRTLYMSLVGARDLSVINTPPEDRLPIQSVICQGTDAVLKNALIRELSRDGQAYVVHNRVETIFDYAERVRKLLPGARIVVAHGQMSSAELDTVFHTYKSGQADILVATSIIENGLDIPNANTMLIDRADRFGLADLYQMRGRVGRWNRKAYCYFLVPSTADLNIIARKRLTALTEASGHGGGMKIAMHDLEIRGAGNILGIEQSGHVQAVGFHFYCKMLKRAVKRLKHQQTLPLMHDVKIELPVDAKLPDTYVNDVALRMEMYGRLADAESTEELTDLEEELIDRFGPLPEQALWLMATSHIRLFCKNNAFSLIKISKVTLSAEQHHGKKKKISKKLMFKLTREPREGASQVINSLKESFPFIKN